jgi:LmbE family N-acetylglucosaminyl deacetylase
MPCLLCLVAHPDDETILCGGTLALLAAHGVAVHVSLLTRGEGGDLGEPALTDREHLGQVREQETRCAASALGVKSVSFLGYVDPTVGPNDELNAPAHDLARLTEQISASLQQTGAQVLLTHGSNGEYGHPAHKLVHQAALATAAALREAAPLVYSFAAHYANHPRPRLANTADPAEVVVDVTGFLDQKTAAALCHRTQNPLFVRRQSAAAGRQLTVREVLLTEESFHRHWPLPATPDLFLEWVAPR